MLCKGTQLTMSGSTSRVVSSVQLSFVPRIKGARKHALFEGIKWTPMEFAREALLRKKEPSAAFTMQEHFTGDTWVHPYYDWDFKVSSSMRALTNEEKEALEEVKEAHLTRFKETVEKLHPPTETSTEHPGTRILYASRHGPVEDASPNPKGGNSSISIFKISYRAFVLGVKMQAKDIPSRARQILNLGPKEVPECLDLSVYKAKEQLLGVIYGCKDTDKVKRYLTPLDESVALEDYLVQNVRDDDIVLDDWSSASVDEVSSFTGKQAKRTSVSTSASTTWTSEMADKHYDDFVEESETDESAWGDIRRLLSCVRRDRSEARSEWRVMGILLQNEGEKKGDMEGAFNVFEDFSKWSVKYDEGQCKTDWDGLRDPDFKGPELKEATLIHWAKKENPERHSRLFGTMVRSNQMSNAIDEFQKKVSGGSPNGQFKVHPDVERIHYQAHRVTVPCLKEQFCPIHKRVHDAASCWMDVFPAGQIEFRCGLDPHLPYPDPPFVLQNVQSMFTQVNINVGTLIPSKQDTIFQKIRNIVMEDCGRLRVKKDRSGLMYEQVSPSVPYAYVKKCSIREFVQDALKDNADALDDPCAIDKATKLLTDHRMKVCDFLEIDRHLLGFPNGVLNIMTCEFIEREAFTSDAVVRKYFDKELHVGATTPSFDRLIGYQLPTDACEMLCVLIGRLFFKIKERDNWQVMVYVLGEEAGTGKSSLINTVKSMFSDVGAITSNFEPIFGLSGLVDKEIVITDDLPAKMKDILDQQLFQTMVSGGATAVPTKNKTATSPDWTVPQIFGGNWHLNYIDKGQVSRRVVEFVFEKVIVEKDTQLEEKILQELPQIMYRCLSAYKRCFEQNGGNDFWKFCPQSLRDQKDELRESCNPLFNFLKNSDRVLFQEGATTDLDLIRSAFCQHIGKSVKKLDRPTFRQVNPKWEVVKDNACKSCGSLSGSGCCPKYQNNNRRCVYTVHNLLLTKSHQ